MQRRTRSSENSINSKLLSIEELQTYLSVGRNTAANVGKESGALRKIGRRALYDREKIDKFIDSLGA